MKRHINISADNNHVKNIAAYKPVLESYRQIAETQTGRDTAIIEGFRTGGDLFRKAVVDATLSPLVKQINQAKVANDTEAVAYLESLLGTVEEAVNVSADRVQYLESRTFDVSPFAALTLPYMYLNVIGNAALKIVENKPQRVNRVHRELVKKFYKIGNTKYYLPDALKDPKALEAIKKRRGSAIKVVVPATKANGVAAAGAANSFDKLLKDAMTAAGVQANDLRLLSLIEEVTLTGIKVGTGNMTPVNPLVANRRKEGLFGGTVKPAGGTTAYTVQGKFNFQEMKLELCSVSEDMDLEFEVSVDNGSGATSIISGSEKKVDEFVIGAKLEQESPISDEMIYDFKTVENADLNTMILGSFMELEDAVMDSDIFEHLLANESPINDLYSDGGTTANPIALKPAAGAYSGTPLSYKQSVVAEALMDMATDLSTTLNAPALMKFFCHPHVANLINGDELLRLDTVGGVKLDSPVRNLALGSYACQLISSERLEASYGTGNKLMDIRGTVQPTINHSPINECFIVPHIVSHNRRSAENPYLPAVSMVSRYAVKSVFPIAGKRTFTL